MAKKIIFYLLAISLFGCASIPGNKVKLSDYSEIKKEETKNINLSYQNNDFLPKKDGKNFNYEINKKFEYYEFKEFKDQRNSANCIIKISSNNDYGTSKICKAYGILAGFTLFILPAYCNWDFEAKATLISTRDNKVLKEYYLKDKTHEIWSSLWFLSWFIYNPKSAGTPEGANKLVEQAISEALTRQILNDAAEFKECQKSPTTNPKNANR